MGPGRVTLTGVREWARVKRRSSTSIGAGPGHGASAPADLGEASATPDPLFSEGFVIEPFQLTHHVTEIGLSPLLSVGYFVQICRLL